MFLSAIGALTLTTLGVTPPQHLGARVNEQFGLADSVLVEVRVDGQLGGQATAHLALNGSMAEIRLDPVSVVSDDFELLEQRDDGSFHPVEPGPLRTYRGYVVGVEGSRIAASWFDEGLYARITLGADEDYWLQPVAASMPDVRPDVHVLYESSDVLSGNHKCGTDLIAQPGRQTLPIDADATMQKASGGNDYVAELGCDADHEYFLDYGSSQAVMNRINAVINTMNQQYEDEVDITHLITTIIVRSSPNDPYTSTDAVTLLNQFRNEWQNNQGGIVRDVAELFTGKNLNGGTIGIAWLSGVCNSFGYNVVQSDFNGSFACTTDLSAHELGHNWSADHCSCTSNTMNPFITCANRFHPSFTIPQIIAFRNTRNCLDEPPPPCDDVPETYCTGKTASNGFVPTMSFTGSSSQATNDLVLRIFLGPKDKPGVILFSDNGRAAIPFQGGLLCVNPAPLERGDTFVFDNFGRVLIPINITPQMIGITRNYQGWGRDTLQNGSMLSDAGEVIFCP